MFKNRFGVATTARAAGTGLFFLALLTFFPPPAQALTIGPTLIVQCPSCTNALRRSTIGSGNYIGAKFWTDGLAQAPMLPLQPLLVKCPHCRKLMWLDDAKKLGELLAMESEKKWEKAARPIPADEADYLAAADAKGISREHELHARRRAWWLANDPARGDPSHTVIWTEPRKKNLERLSALLDSKKDDELLSQAEIARELGRFDSCLQLLNRKVRAQLQPSADLIIRLAKAKDARVTQIQPVKR